MNLEQIKGIVERVATIGFGYAAGHGWIPADSVGAFVTVMGILASSGWGYYVNTHKALAAATQKVGAPT